MEIDRKQIKIIAILITIVSLILIIYTLVNQTILQEKFSAQVQVYGIPSLFILSFLLDLIPQLVSPFMTLIAGIVAGINIHYAILSTIIGSTIGSLLGFAIGKKYMYKAVHLTTSDSAVEKLTYLTNKYGKIIVPLTAISPLPYLPVLLGAMNLTKKNFLIYGLIPRAIGIAIYGYLIHLIG
ncbi:VTT domain-containing protein [Candidatus Pacearchaeota archaeon]|nr:VTT domain-containing protein [Candidatus Pacearchaeota archaeon]